MRRVDQQADALACEIFGQALGAAEAAAANRHRMGQRVHRAAGERQRDGKAFAAGKLLRKLPRFGGAAEKEDPMGHGRGGAPALLLPFPLTLSPQKRGEARTVRLDP